MNQWSVLTCKLSQTLLVANEIASLGAESYCPIIKYFTKPKRKASKVEVIQAAFPGYLFAAEDFDNFDATPKLKLSRVRQLRLGEHFCTVPEIEIERLRAEDSDRVILDECEKFLVGDHVKVISGPLFNQEGMLVSVKGSRCELSVIGINVKIFMPSFSLKLKSRAFATVQ